jgi:hypothetical protein
MGKRPRLLPALGDFQLQHSPSSPGGTNWVSPGPPPSCLPQMPPKKTCPQIGPTNKRSTILGVQLTNLGSHTMHSMCSDAKECNCLVICLPAGSCRHIACAAPCISPHCSTTLGRILEIEYCTAAYYHIMSTAAMKSHSQSNAPGLGPPSYHLPHPPSVSCIISITPISNGSAANFACHQQTPH